VSAAVVGEAGAAGEEDGGGGGLGGLSAGAIGSGPAAPAVELGAGETLVAAAKRHFLVTQTATAAPGPGPGLSAAAGSAAFSGPSVSGTRSFITGGAANKVRYVNHHV